MKENKNKRSQRDQQQKGEKQSTSTNNPNTGASPGGVQRQEGAVKTPEKKPYSHRTGDATNFGDRSYQED